MTQPLIAQGLSQKPQSPPQTNIKRILGYHTDCAEKQQPASKAIVYVHCCFFKLKNSASKISKVYTNLVTSPQSTNSGPKARLKDLQLAAKNSSRFVKKNPPNLNFLPSEFCFPEDSPMHQMLSWIWHSKK